MRTVGPRPVPQPQLERGGVVTEELVRLREVQGPGPGTAECCLGFLSLSTLLRYPA